MPLDAAAAVPPPAEEPPAPPPLPAGHRSGRIELQVEPRGSFQPGDRVLLRCREHLTMEDLDHLRTELAAQFPGVQFVVVDGIDEVLVYRSSEGPA